MQITQQYLKEIFLYQDGDLFWKVDRRKVKVGQKAGRRKSNGYCEIRLDGKLQGTHRLIFLLFHGFLPQIIDHIDGNPSNNRIENLREASHAQNMRNSIRPKNNTSGFKGVYFDKRINKWVSQCVKDKQKFYLGAFENIHDAADVVIKFRELNHKEFARHN